nr:MAG: hypothetical protein H2BulkLitter121735_000002 [Mitovirus sp.]
MILFFPILTVLLLLFVWPFGSQFEVAGNINSLTFLSVLNFILIFKGLVLSLLIWYWCELYTLMGKLPFLRIWLYGRAYPLKISILGWFLGLIWLVSFPFPGLSGMELLLPILTRPLALPTIRQLFFRPIGTYWWTTLANRLIRRSPLLFGLFTIGRLVRLMSAGSIFLGLGLVCVMIEWAGMTIWESLSLLPVVQVLDQVFPGLGSITISHIPTSVALVNKVILVIGLMITHLFAKPLLFVGYTMETVYSWLYTYLTLMPDYAANSWIKCGVSYFRGFETLEDGTVRNLPLTLHPNSRSYQLYLFVKDLYVLHRNLGLGIGIIGVNETPLALPPETVDIIWDNPNISAVVGSCIALVVIGLAKTVIPPFMDSFIYLWNV